jgi:hypothetical protein
MNSVVRIALAVAITVPWVSEAKAMSQTVQSSNASAAIRTVRIGQNTVKMPPKSVLLGCVETAPLLQY